MVRLATNSREISPRREPYRRHGRRDTGTAGHLFHASRSLIAAVKMSYTLIVAAYAEFADMATPLHNTHFVYYAAYSFCRMPPQFSH